MRAQFIRPPSQPIRDGATPKNVAEATGQGYAGRDNSPFFHRFNFLTIRDQTHATGRPGDADELSTDDADQKNSGK
jgi:hypothetical protein